MRKKITAVFSKLLAFIIILSVFTSLAGCNKGSTLETVSEVGYRLDHIDSFYKYSSSGKGLRISEFMGKSASVRNS